MYPLLIGDETTNGGPKGEGLGYGLGNALPHAGPATTDMIQLSVDTWPGSDAYDWVRKNRIQNTWETLSKRTDANGNKVALPDLILISLGLSDIFHEPDLSPDDLKLLGDDAVALVDQAAKTGAKVAWILPPKTAHEGKARDIIAAALATRNVRTFHSDTRPYEVDASGAISDDAYAAWAKDIYNWVPLGPRPIGPLGPRHPGGQTGGFLDFFGVKSTPAGIALSRNAKIGFSVAGVLLVGVGIAGLMSGKGSHG